MKNILNSEFRILVFWILNSGILNSGIQNSGILNLWRNKLYEAMIILTFYMGDFLRLKQSEMRINNFE
jgi:hypothetical protein